MVEYGWVGGMVEWLSMVGWVGWLNGCVWLVVKCWMVGWSKKSE